MLNTRCELFARDSAYIFSFSYFERNFVKFLNKQQFQTQSHKNLGFHSKMIYSSNLVARMILVTMVPPIQKKSLSLICKGIPLCEVENAIRE